MLIRIFQNFQVKILLMHIDFTVIMFYNILEI